MTSPSDDSGRFPEQDPAPRTVFRSACGCLRQNLIPAILLIIVVAFLYWVSKYNFALFHTAIEFATIAVAVAIFLLVWKSRHIVQNNYLLFIGITFVFIAILDFLHTTVYQGVGIFPEGGGTLSTRLWIAARYMQAVTLLAAPLLIRKKTRIDLIVAVYLAADVIIVASIFIFRNFPATYIEGVGLTPFKIFSEYIISFLMIGAVVLLYKNRESFDRQVLDNLIVAILLLILSELAFTEYASFVDIFSVLGHVVRLGAYYFFYRAIIEVGQEKPYNLIYRDLNESEKKYRALIDLSPDAIVVLRDEKILYANKAGLRMAGVPSIAEIAGKSFHEYLHPDDWAGSDQRRATIMATGTAVPIKEIRIVVGGKVVPAEVTSGPVLWDGKPAVQVVIRDISERKKADDAIAALNKDRKTILDNMPAMIWYKDTRNNFIRVNASVAKNTGIPAESFEGKNASELFPDESQSYYQDDLEVIHSGAPRYGIVEQLATKGGRKIWVQTDKIPLRDDAGTVTGVLVFSIDITERKRAEEELAQRNADLHSAYEDLTAAQRELRLNVHELTRREHELQENEKRLRLALEEKEVLLSEIHHRVKNNLTAFISLLSLENSYEESPAGIALKKDLQNRARSMALIHETLYRTKMFSRVDMDLYLGTLIEQIATTYSPFTPITMLVEADGVTLDLARATPCGLIVNELVTNSFKYAFPDTFDCTAVRNEPCTIRVSLVIEDGTYHLRVSDNGKGLPADFDIRTAQSLGLKLVNFLAKHQLRATVDVSTVNGTEFSIQFRDAAK
jgi:PAS domain S-box-containing protein